MLPGPAPSGPGPCQARRRLASRSEGPGGPGCLGAAPARRRAVAGSGGPGGEGTRPGGNMLTWEAPSYGHFKIHRIHGAAICGNICHQYTPNVSIC